MLKIYSYYFEELVFKFTLGENEGADNPPWLDSEDFPPLPPREAIAISRLAVLDMLKAFPYAEPEFDTCALKKANYAGSGWWYYVIDWTVYPPECGDRSVVSVPVLLNGRVPSYEVFKYEDRSTAWRT